MRSQSIASYELCIAHLQIASLEEMMDPLALQKIPMKMVLLLAKSLLLEIKYENVSSVTKIMYALYLKLYHI